MRTHDDKECPASGAGAGGAGATTTCTNVKVDEENCGDCGVPCDGKCINGVCQP